MANEWRSVCGEIRPASAASRTHFASRRRMSEVERRRPRWETNSASSPRARLERVPRRLQVAAECALGDLADRHHSRLAPLARHPHGLRVEVDVSEVERDQLLRSQSAGVREFEQGTVANLERRSRRDPIEKAGDVVGGEDARQPRVALRRRQQVGRVLLGAAVGDEVGVEAAHGSQLAGDARLRQAAPGELGGIAPEAAVDEGARLEPRARRPVAELEQVTPVGPDRRRRGASRRELAQVGVDCSGPAGARFELGSRAAPGFNVRSLMADGFATP